MSNKKSDKNNNQIIMVNSFKGGCGKTSIALSLCATESIEYFNELEQLNKDKKEDEKIKPKRNMLYLDIDILGTASEHSIFNKDKTPIYMDAEKGIDKHTNVVEFEGTFGREEKLTCKFTAMLLHPIARETTCYTSNINIRKNSGSLDVVLLKKIVEFLSDFVKNNKEFFIVLDCSPGFNDSEKFLIEQIHEINRDPKTNNFRFIECFVTTLDKSHIEKTISSLRNVTLGSNNLDERNIAVIINDLTNLSNWNEKMDIRDSIDPKSYLQKLCTFVKTRIVNEFKDGDEKDNAVKRIFVTSNSYGEKISEANLMFLNERDIKSKPEMVNSICLESAPDAYNNNTLREGVLYYGK